MRLVKVELQNFRCYKNATLELGEAVTVLIGRNGAGKSSLLSAIRRGLSFVFSDKKGEINPLKENNNCTIRSLALLDTRFDESGGGFQWPTSIKYEGRFNNGSINWEFYKKSDPGGLHSTLYRDAKSQVLEGMKLNNELAPIFAFYGDSFPHSIMNSGVKASKIIRSSVILPRDFSYYGWDEYTGCNDLWEARFAHIDSFILDITSKLSSQLKRLEHLDNDAIPTSRATDFEGLVKLIEEREPSLYEQFKLQILKAREFQKERDYICDRILKFTRPLEEKYNFINDEFQVIDLTATASINGGRSIRYLLQDGRSIYSEMLPMGYKRLLNVVIDLAYRSYILGRNQFVPSGIAIIDEIELHLHPTLQQEVLQRFVKTFPELQFVFTTHSPLVISNFRTDEKNRLVGLEHEGSDFTIKPLPNLFGVSYESNLRQFMGAEPRSSTIDKLINLYLTFKSNEKDHGAAEVYNKLIEYIGEDDLPKVLKDEIERKVSSLKK